MQRLIRPILLPVILAVVIPTTGTTALAQADAERAFQQAETFLADGQFEEARDMAKKATETDAKNPEAWLLLGKAHYQLGELDEAIAAWKKTLSLAPEEPFAKRMLTVLRTNVTDIDTRIKLIEALIEQELYSPAFQECVRVAADKALSDVQQATVKKLRAEASLGMGNHADALRVLREVLVLHPTIAGDVKVSLLLGTAKLRAGGDAAAEGVTILKELVAEHSDLPEAAIAQYEVVAFDLRQKIDNDRVDAMAQWVAGHGNHKLADAGRRQLLGAYLALAAQTGKATPESELTADETKALTLAAEIYGREQSASKTAALIAQLLSHFKTRYVNQDVHSPAIQAVETLLAGVISKNDRRTLIAAVGSYRYDAAVKQADARARAEAVAAWLAKHPDHETVAAAQDILLGTYLSLALQSGKPTPKADMTDDEARALTLAVAMHNRERSASKKTALIGRLVTHFKTRYSERGIPGPAIAALETLLDASPGRTDRLTLLRTVATLRAMAATKWLDATAKAGKLPTGVARDKLPETLAAALATFETIRGEYPTDPMWTDQAYFAKQVRAYSSRVLPTPQFIGLKGPDAWALDLAMPVVKGDAHATSTKSAIETITAIIQDHAKVNKAGPRKLALELSTQLLSLVSKDDPSWATVITAHEKVAADYAVYLFQENTKAGRADDNATLSDAQKAYLNTLTVHVQTAPAFAPSVPPQLAAHVKPWIDQSHWEVAHEVYAMFTRVLPEPQRRQTELAVVGLWVRQATVEHGRLSTIGLSVPKELDPLLVKALQRCYALQAGLDSDDAALAHVRAAWEAIVGHYKHLEYFDTAEAAIKVKADRAVDAADEYAALQLARLKDEHARREFARRLSLYGAPDEIELGRDFRLAIDGWQRFVVERPNSPFVSQAIGAVFDIARLFEQHQAHQVAAEIYGNMVAFGDKFAAKIELLNQSTPGSPSIIQRAAFARADAIDAHARKLLAKQMADRVDKTVVPKTLSKEFTAAIEAYNGLIEQYGDSPRIGRATRKIMAVALEYARIDAWEVADSIFADVLDSDLPIHRPERIEFARGLCRLGPAMPGHARELLSTLASAGLRGPGQTGSGTMLAYADLDATDEAAADDTELRGTMGFGRGGMGGMGGMIAGGSMSSTVNGPAGRPVVPQSPDATPARTSPSPQPVTVTAEAERDSQLLAMINRHESNRAAQVAQLREQVSYNNITVNQSVQMVQQGERQQAIVAVPTLSIAELARQEKALSSAYDVFQGIRKDYPRTPTAQQARGEILVMVGHWRGLGQWQRSAALAKRFLTDNPTDRQLPKLRLEIARDRLSWASKRPEGKLTKQAMLAEVSGRYDEARTALAQIVTDFPKEKTYQQQAQWDIANSFLTQARVVGAISSTLARGQYVRTAKELQKVAREYPKHPKIGTIPQMLWTISTELEGRANYNEAILVWNDLTIHDPMHGLAQQAATKIAQTYHQNLRRPLLAAQAYQELNFIRGGNDVGLQNAIFQIGSDLKTQQRWVEALHVLETFVDSFPRHAQAGQALTMVGQIHQTNEAWKDAIAAYRRVTAEFKNGQWIQEAKWAIAECTINLSQWREASDAYRAYVAAYPGDAKVAEANRRIDVLKDLARYQGLVDEEDQRKAFDAQHQIAQIVAAQLTNPVKAIIEYRKVVSNWPKSHLADDALYAVGTTYLKLGETEKAREALLEMAGKYETSPLADDALYMVGKSYEDEAGSLATVTREKQLRQNKDVAQRRAYQKAQDNRFRQEMLNTAKIADLRKAGKSKSAEVAEASAASNYGQFNDANVRLFAQKAEQEVASETASQLADRQDKINAALRLAVDAYNSASQVAGADKADEALLQMATIYDQRLKDSKAAMTTWLEIVNQFAGTTVAEDASWRIAQYHEREQKWAEAIEAYKAFLRNYRRSPNAGAAQFAIAESYEHLGEWVNAMDSYSNYLTNFPQGPLVQKAKEQINWIKTYRL